MNSKQYASVIVRDSDGKFLSLFHTHKERPWRFPGGKIEQGELAIIAAVRELFEETGVITKGLHLVATTPPDAIDGGSWIGNFFFVDHWVGTPHIKKPVKFNDIRFLSKEELQRFNCYPEYEVVKYL